MQTNDPQQNDRQPRALELTSRQLQLLLKYGYPFPEQEQALRESKVVKGVHRVWIDAYWLELMIGDLVRSAKEIRSQTMLDELDALCDELESALNASRKLHVVSFE